MRDIFLTNRFCLEADIYEWVRRRRWLRRRLSVRFLGRFWWDFWLPKQQRSPKGSRKRVRGKRDAFCARLKIVLCLRQQFKVLCWKCDSLSVERRSHARNDWTAKEKRNPKEGNNCYALKRLAVFRVWPLTTYPLSKQESFTWFPFSVLRCLLFFFPSNLPIEALRPRV